MVKRSKGIRSKTRKKFRITPRKSGLGPLTRSLQRFQEGSRVTIDINSSVHKGQPHNRFQGLTGVVVTQKGDAYLVRVRTGHMEKIIIARPEHLKAQGL